MPAKLFDSITSKATYGINQFWRILPSKCIPVVNTELLELPENVHRSVEELSLIGAHNCVPGSTNRKGWMFFFSTNLNIFFAFHFLIRSPLLAWSPTKISFLNSACRFETALRERKLVVIYFQCPKFQPDHIWGQICYSWMKCEFRPQLRQDICEKYNLI